MRGKVRSSCPFKYSSRITPAYAGKSGSGSLEIAFSWDHPRVCGEKKPGGSDAVGLLGSPLRMRGKVFEVVFRVVAVGITPAYAGKSLLRPADFPQIWDHPRVCGEKLTLVSLNPLYGGSPPRMRGKAGAAKDGYVLGGITPAYAGKSLSRKDIPCSRWDHPRVCGEKRVIAAGMPDVTGSPPRMRGKAVRLAVLVGVGGITPAYAGKRDAARVLATPARDHPRVCGEKRALPALRVAALGSPPRMRGKVKIERKSQKRKRITPAYAGKRGRPAARLSQCPDHPRVCGEKGVEKWLEKTPRGSPPRMRGKAFRSFFGMRKRGITPAYAGKSPALWRVPAPLSGSPPRMRGKAQCVCDACDFPGITPAYAGKS